MNKQYLISNEVEFYNSLGNIDRGVIVGYVYAEALNGVMMHYYHIETKFKGIEIPHADVLRVGKSIVALGGDIFLTLKKTSTI